MNVVALLTDFGHRDPYVGVMKAVITRLGGPTSFLDLTHEVRPQDVRAGQFWLQHSVPQLPEGSWVLAVVDPGVGTARRALAARADGLTFVGPDNGLFTPQLLAARSLEVRCVDVAALWRRHALRSPSGGPSPTFHGRDVFAPAVGALLAGEPLGDLGPAVDPCGLCPAPHSPASVVVVVDHFGNLITDVAVPAAAGHAQVQVAGRALPWVTTFADVRDGECAALLGSCGTVEIIQRGGSAARALGVDVGCPVQVTLNGVLPAPSDVAAAGS